MLKKILVLVGALLLGINIVVAEVIFSQAMKAEYIKRYTDLYNKAATYTKISAEEKALCMQNINKMFNKIQEEVNNANAPDDMKRTALNTMLTSINGSLGNLESIINNPNVPSTRKIEIINQSLLGCKTAEQKYQNLEQGEQNRIAQENAEQERRIEQYNKEVEETNMRRNAEKEAKEKEYAQYFTISAGQGKTYHGRIVNGNYYYAVPYTEVKPSNIENTHFCPYYGTNGTSCIWSVPGEDLHYAAQRACASALPVGYDTTWVSLDELKNMLSDTQSPCFKSDPWHCWSEISKSGSFLTYSGSGSLQMYIMESLGRSWRAVILKPKNGRFFNDVIDPSPSDSPPQHVSFVSSVMCKVLDPNRSKAYIKIKKPQY